MKPTQVTELFANIRKTFVSFFSILMFVALGVGIFVGINWTSPALENAADSVFNENSFHHVQVVFPYGLTDDDIDQLAHVEGVTSIEKGRQAFATLKQGELKYTVKLQTASQDIDKLIVQEGELPQRVGELAFKASVAEMLGLSVGDEIVLKENSNSAAQSSDNPSASNSASTQGESVSGLGSADGSSRESASLLATEKFKVTALVESPEYLALESYTFGVSDSSSGAVDAIGWVPADTFNDDAFQNGYTTANIRSESLEGKGTFTGEYKKESGALEARIEELGVDLALNRYDDLHGEAQQKVAEGEAQLKDAQDKIAQGEQAIEDGERELEEGRATLESKRAEGEAQLASSYQMLLGYEAQKAEGEAELSEARSQLAEGEQAIAEVDAMEAAAEVALSSAESEKAALDKQLKDGKITQEEYDAALDELGAQTMEQIKPYADAAGEEVPVIDHTNYAEALVSARVMLNNAENIPVDIDGEEMTIGEARAKLEEYEQAVDDAEAEYNDKVAQLNEGWSLYYSGRQLLESETAAGEQKIAEGEAQLEDAKRQVEDGKAKVAEMMPKLEDGKRQVDAMKKYTWTVAGRSYNSGCVQVATFSGVTGRLSLSMAALFIVVGLLVTYSAVSRIVHDQITQIGTKKALGLRRREITISFMLYSAIAVLAGAIIGAIVGFVLVEGIISNAIGSMFFMGSFPAFFGVLLFLAITLLELSLVLVATWIACRSILKEHAVELLKGEKPPAAKTRFYEKWGIWEKLPLLTQTIVNNCINDKRRLFSTLVGVAGCTALIVTAITLNDDVIDSYGEHYDRVYGFNAIAYSDKNVDGANDTVKAALEGEGSTAAQVLLRTYVATDAADNHSAMRIVVPKDDEEFEQVYHVNVVDGELYDPTGDGAWVSEAYAEHLGAKVGDELELDGGDGELHHVRIAGFYGFRLTYHELVMGRAFYEREFNTKLEPTALLVNTQDRPVEELHNALKNVNGFDSILDDKTLQWGNFETFSSVSSTVVLIYLILAALMAVVVLLNLNVMFIEEKKRDLIVLMINGFSVKDAKRYIYNDTIVLTIIGIILGLVLGAIMGSITVASIEPETATFFKGIAWRAIVIGILGSALLSVIMTLIALRRIPRFNLTDINKF